MAKKASLIPVFFLMIFPLLASEYIQGAFKLVLHDKIGRFSLYSNSSKGSLPLFVADDPDTSYIKVYKDGKIYSLGNSGTFKLQPKPDKAATSFEWIDKDIIIKEDFAFINVFSPKTADGLLITLTIENTSDTEHIVGLRYLLDTYLGESKNNHVRVNSGTLFNKENSFDKNFMPSYWITSETSAADTNGLAAVLRHNAITLPDKLVFANWQRLNDAEYDYNPNTDYDYNSLPYSINDSAIAAFYESKKIGSKSVRTIRLLLMYSTRNNLEEFLGTTSTTPVATTTPTVVTNTNTSTTDSGTVTSGNDNTSDSTPVNANADASQVLASLQDIENLLQQINAALAKDPVDLTEIQQLQDELDRLTKNKQKLSQ